MSEPTARKRLGRYLEGGAGLRDRSSRPKVSPRAIAPSEALAIMELRRRNAAIHPGRCPSTSSSAAIFIPTHAPGTCSANASRRVATGSARFRLGGPMLRPV